MERHATSQTLPRSANKYISSFIGFAPAANPQILGMCVIYNPQGVYYGGTIAAPVIRDIFDNIFPYLGIEKDVEMQYTKLKQNEQKEMKRCVMDYTIFLPVIIAFALSAVMGL